MRGRKGVGAEPNHTTAIKAWSSINQSILSGGRRLEPNLTTAKKRGLFQCIFTAIGGSALPIVQSPLAHNEEFAAYNYLNAQAKSF